MSLAPGSRLGPYEIVAPAGAGGMGEVYRAKDTRLDRTVAIKVLPSHLSDRPELRQRLDREARAISSLSHPHICALHDVGHQDGVDFLVMEFLEGDTLADRLRKGALPAEQLLRAGLEIADALDAAHRQGIVHRDLKPGNVMLTKSGVKLLDFGLAKAIEPTAASTSGFSALPTRSDDLTGEGTILGTFQYMAPEQLEGKEADARTDLFALGAVLYEMATGRKAFEGKSQASLIAAILEREPAPISTIAPMTPPALDRLVKTCLAKNPDDRWQTAHDVALQLRWIAEGGSVAGVPAPVAARRRGRERVAWALAAVALVAAAAVSVAHFSRAPAVVRPVRSFLLPPTSRDFDFGTSDCGSLTVSPNGRYVTFAVGNPDGNSLLWLRSLDDLTARPLVGTEEGIFPFWSPDSRQIGFFAGGKLKRIDLAGSPPINVCDAPDGRGGTWGRDGTILFAPDWRTGIHRVSAAGGAATPVTTLDDSRNETTHRWPVFLPDGRHFLYTAGEHGTERQTESNAIFLATLGSDSQTLLLNARSNVGYGSGRLLYVRENALLVQPFDLKKLRLSGDPVPLADDVGYASDYFRANFSASENGVLVYESGAKEAKAELGWYDRNGRKVGSVGEPADYGAFTLSPDEGRIAATVGNPSTGTTDVWIYELARGVGTRLTFGSSNESEAVWSPDGKRIVYRQLDRTWSDMYIKDAGGTGREEALLKSESDKIPLDWSPDGSVIAYDVIDPSMKTKADIWMLPMSGDRKPYPFIVTEFDEWYPQFSPDGRWLLYFSNESGRNEVYVTAFPGGGDRWQISTGGGQGGQWSRGGREVVYVAADGEGIISVEVKAGVSTFEVGTPKPLFQLAGVTGADAAADGERFFAAVNTSAAVKPAVTLVTGWDAGIAERE